MVVKSMRHTSIEMLYSYIAVPSLGVSLPMEKNFKEIHYGFKSTN